MAAKLLIDFPVKDWAYSVVLEPGQSYDVGASSTHRITLPPGMVAEDHAEFVWRDDRWIVRDLGSDEGTFVNGERVRECALAHGDVVRVGECDIVYHGDDGRQPLATRQQARQFVAELQSALNTVVAQARTKPIAADDLDKAGANVFARTAPLRPPSPRRQAPRAFAPAGLPAAGAAGLPASDLVWVAQTLAAILGEVLAQPGDRESVSRLMLERLREAIRADNGFVMIPDDQTNQWVIRAWVGDMSRWTSYGREHPVPLTVANSAFDEVRVVSNALPSEAPASDQKLESESIFMLQVNAYIAVPLLRNRERIGVLYFDTRDPGREFQPRDVKLLERAGSYIAEIELQTG